MSALKKYLELIDEAQTLPDRTQSAEKHAEYIYSRLMYHGCNHWTQTEVLTIIQEFDSRPTVKGTITIKKKEKVS